MKTRLLYIANIRLPTEKAHGLQILQNCEALAEAGAEVTLWVGRRTNTPEIGAVGDVWAYYGVKRNFSIRRIPCLDFLWLVPGRNGLLARLIFYLQQATFLLFALLGSLLVRADVYYSRDPLALLAFGLLKPRRKLAYEAHRLASGQGGRWVQRQAVRRVGTVIAITARLAEDLAQLNPHPPTPSPSHREGEKNTRQFLVAHDGIRRERFANVPSQAQARVALGWPEQAFIVGYVGRLQTMTMDKGVGTLIDALGQVEGATLALVGGPDDLADALRQSWLALRLDGARFINAGQVAPARVPLYLSALDVCAMPFPWTEHFAYYASPMKLFEYMASRRAIVASDLPSAAEVLRDGETALLVPPGDAGALAAAIIRLRHDPDLRARLADCAYREVMEGYTWAARARVILNKVMRDE